jgi:hypothetical protein
MGLFKDRDWLRETRHRVLWPSPLSIYRSWAAYVVELTALRDEKDLEALDVLFSFGRYERVLALLQEAEGAAPGLPTRELAVRKAVCLCVLGREQEARRVLVDAWAHDEDPVLAFELTWLSRLRGWEPVRLPSSAEFDWVLATRFDAQPPLLEEARALRWEESNWLFQEDRRQAPLSELDIGPRYFPLEPAVALWTALLWARKGTGREDTVEDSLQVATREWPELWNVLTVDPLFQPYVAPPRPTPPVLPALLSERLQLWHVIDIAPEPGSGSASIPLGTYCPEPYDFDDHPLYTLRDTLGHLGLLDTRERVPPFRVEVSQYADRFSGRYDRDVLAPLRALAAHANDVWFFLRDINREYTDELCLRAGRYGFRRWSLAHVEADPHRPMIEKDHALLRTLEQGPESRFRSAEFQRVLRHFSPGTP